MVDYIKIVSRYLSRVCDAMCLALCFKFALKSPFSHLKRIFAIPSLSYKNTRERERPPLQPAIMSSDAKSGKKTASKAAATGSSIPVNTNIIVMDNGGDTIKIGFAGQISPTALVPNCVCKPHGVKAIIVGLDTLNIPDINGLVIRRPIDRGY